MVIIFVLREQPQKGQIIVQNTFSSVTILKCPNNPKLILYCFYVHLIYTHLHNMLLVFVMYCNLYLNYIVLIIHNSSYSYFNFCSPNLWLCTVLTIHSMFVFIFWFLSIFLVGWCSFKDKTLTRNCIVLHFNQG